MIPDSIQALSILIILIPGFISTKVINFLAVRKRLSEIDKVIEALVLCGVNFILYKIFVESALSGFCGRFFENSFFLSVDQLLKFDRKLSISYVASFIIMGVLAFLLGLFVSWLLRNNLFLNKLAGLKQFPATTATIMSVFEKDANMSYVTLTLDDGRKVAGWPYRYPIGNDDDAIFLTEAVWIFVDGSEMEIPQGVLIPNINIVKSIDFIGVKNKDV